MKAIFSVLPVLSLLFAATAAMAQGVSVKGTVKDAAGAAVIGAVVKLEKAGYSTVTGADGSFTVTETSTGIARGMEAGAALRHADIRRGSLRIELAKASEVSIATYGLGGKSISEVTARLDAGIHNFPLPESGEGIQVHSIRAGRDERVVRSLALPTGGRAGLETGTPNFALAKAAAGFSDVVLVTKEGQVNYRIGVASPTASGLDIRMVANAGNVTDADGNVYQSVKLGNQTWTVDHFRSTKYNDGAAIPMITDAAAWAGRTAGAYCYYNNSTNADTNKLFAPLYNWHAVNTGKLAPAGWRLPNNADWIALESWLIANGGNHDGTTSGNKIAKAMSSRTNWNTSAVAGAVGNDQSKNNKSGFNAIPSGFRLQTGTFTSKGGRSIIQSTTEYADPFGWFADIDVGAAALRRSDDWKVMGFSVRLVK